jgi:diguanylate cyclase (GGDEF)-like protein
MELQLSIYHGINPYPLKIHSQAKVFQAIKLMNQTQASYILINEGKKLRGIFTERDVVKLQANKIDIEKVNISEVMTSQLITLEETEVKDIIAVIAVFRKFGIRHLPIINNQEELIGIINYETIRNILKPADLLKFRQVKDSMITNVISSTLTTSVLELTELMANHRISCIVIVGNTDGKLSNPIGIVTERDIVKLTALQVNFNHIQAQDIMSAPVLKIYYQDTLWSAYEKMRINRIRRLIATDELGQMVGLITQSSMLNLLNPLEMCIALEALQQVVDNRTNELMLANEKLQHQIARERIMSTIAHRIRQSLNLDTILKTTVEELRQFLQADRVIVYKFNHDWTGQVIIESVSKEYPSFQDKNIVNYSLEKDYIEEYKNGNIHQVDDIYTHKLSESEMELVAALKMRSSLVLPILRCQDLWGLLAIHQCSSRRQWHQWETEFLQELVIQLGIAIQQTELYEKLHKLNKQLTSANRKLQRLATIDGLTQVANRRYFNEYLNKEWRRLMRDNQPISLILCDIDYFKFYNDNYGHQLGDECLQKVARQMQNAIRRPADLVARYGGEEFAIILPNTDYQGAIYVAEKMTNKIQSSHIPHAKSLVNNYITMSVGVVTTLPCAETSPEMLINAADQALYEAKLGGRNQIISYQL